jgi:hypothetical protein
VFILREEREPLLQEYNKLICHFWQIMYVAIPIRITEARAYWIVDKHDICKFVPRSIIIFEMFLVLQPIWANFHQGSILRTAARPTIQPYHCPLPVRNMSILEMPKEYIAIVFWADFDKARSSELATVHRQSFS